MRIIFVDRVYERRPVKIAQLVNANIRSVMHGHRQKFDEKVVW